jgi:hypothetical protein
VLIQGSFREGSTVDRKPPELLLHQAAILADSEKFIFVSGLFSQLQDVQVFLEKYGTVLSPEAVTLFFVENINKPMLINLAGVDFRFIPYKDGMVWNETLDVLYIEKSDLKGQSAEDKVVTAYEAAKSYKFKADTLTYDEALANTFVVKKDLASGPV